jgi:hypothetical protein
MNRKGTIGATISILIVVIIVIAVYFAVVSSRDCNRDSECPAHNYCGADHECHKFEIIQVEKQGLIFPALIIGIAMIVSAYILRKRRDRYV